MNTGTPPPALSANRRVWRLAWPNIVSNLLFTAVGFMHIKIVAELGTSAVAAVTTGHRVFFLIQAILMGVSVAATALIARYWGAGDFPRAERVAWTSMALAIAVAALLSIPVLTLPYPIASLFGLDEATTRLAAGFVFWLGVFNIFSALNMMLGTALRATGNVITPLWFLLFSATLNIILAYLLAFGIGPFPQFGVAGVALGGSGGAAVVTLLFVATWWLGKFNLGALKKWTLDWTVGKQLITIGAPAVIEQGIVQLAFLAFFGIVGQYGTTAYAAYGIGISLVSFSIVIGFGFGIATATLVGQHLGAGEHEQAMAAGKRSLRMACSAMLVLSGALAWFAQDLARFMIDEPDVIHLTTVFIYCIALAQPLMAFEFTLSGALRGAGDTRFPLIATFCGIVFGRLLPAWLFVTLGLSIYWIFPVMILDYAIKAAMLYFRYRSGKWMTIRFSSADSTISQTL